MTARSIAILGFVVVLAIAGTARAETPDILVTNAHFLAMFAGSDAAASKTANAGSPIADTPQSNQSFLFLKELSGQTRHGDADATFAREGN